MKTPKIYSMAQNCALGASGLYRDLSRLSELDKEQIATSLVVSSYLIQNSPKWSDTIELGFGRLVNYSDFSLGRNNECGYRMGLFSSKLWKNMGMVKTEEVTVR